jgi:RNA polymerase sigma factor (TIGR02999 family)
MDSTEQLILRVSSDDPLAGEQLFSALYEKLKELARIKLSKEQDAKSLQVTALVHEAYMKIRGGPPSGELWESEPQFLGIAANAMRQVLVDHARRRKRLKRGGGQRREMLPFVEELVFSVERADELLELDEALDELKKVDPTAAELVELRYFVGLTQRQAAESLGISTRAADRVWAYAKAWLYDHIRGAD